MKNDGIDRIVYSINVKDIQEVAKQILGRNLGKKEIASVEESIDGYIDWFQAVENAIHEQIRS